MTTNDNEWYKEWQLVTTSGTTSYNEWQLVIASDRKRQRVVISVKVFSLLAIFAGMIILKTKRSFLIAPANANSSRRCIENLCKFIHVLSLNVQTIQENYVRDTLY